MAQTQGYPAIADILTYLAAQGVEEITENNESFLTEFRQMLWQILNRTESAGALSVYADTTTTIKVSSGKYWWNGEYKSYAGSSAINPTDDDTTYVWMGAGNTVSSAIDGTGWPSTEHIKLAEVTVDSDGNITAITDRRPSIQKTFNNGVSAGGVETGGVCAKRINNTGLVALLDTSSNTLFSINNGDRILEVLMLVETAAGTACTIDVGFDSDADGSSADTDGWLVDGNANSAGIYSSNDATYDGVYVLPGKAAAADGNVTITSSADISSNGTFSGQIIMTYIPCEA